MATTPGPEGAVFSEEERGTARRGLTGTAVPAPAGEDPAVVIDFSKMEVDETWEFPDIVEEAALSSEGSAARPQEVLLGEVMIRIMQHWKNTNNLKYPIRKKGEGGIGPARRPGEQKVFIGRTALPQSNFRSCSPTTFRALMEALDGKLPDGRDMEKHKSVFGYYKKWQCMEGDGAYPVGSAIDSRKGAIDVIVDAKLGRELAVGSGMDITKIADLMPGDILQTWNKTQVKKKDTAGKVIKKDGEIQYDIAWGGHSSIVLHTRDGLWVISATTPEGSPAIKEQKQKGYAAWFLNTIFGKPVPEWGLQKIYVARTTHKVATLA